MSASRPPGLSERVAELRAACAEVSRSYEAAVVRHRAALDAIALDARVGRVPGRELVRAMQRELQSLLVASRERRRLGEELLLLSRELGMAFGTPPPAQRREEGEV